MPKIWPLVPRRALDEVHAALGRNPAGIALLGNEGVGKTTLAAQGAALLDRGEPVWAVGTATQSMIPFGAFGPLLDVHDVGKPAAMIRSAADSLLARADSAPIIVDNARLLDPLSASLVYHLAQQAAAGAGSPLIVTVRSVLRVPQVVAALWNDGLLERVDVLPFNAAEAAAAVTAAGIDTDRAAIFRRSAGSPLHLRMLLTTGGGEETLSAAIDRFLVGLPGEAREALGHLCVFEPLSTEDLTAVAGESAVAAALETGAVQAHDNRCYAGHPLFLERLAATVDKADVRRWRNAIVAQFGTRASRTPGDRLGRAVLALQSEEDMDCEAVVNAAQEALRLGDLGLAERLARGALNRDNRPGQHFPARLALSYALAWQGRGREAESVLGAVDTEALTEEELMAWALPRAANQFWMLSEPERAAVFLQTVRHRVGTASSRITLDALSGTFAMNAGNVRRALDIADGVLGHADAPDMAVAWAASAAALSSARMGRLDAVGPLVDRALGSEYPGLLRFTVGLAEITHLLMTAQTDAAFEAARCFTDFAESAQPGRAIGEVLMAHVLLAEGEAAAATELLEPAAKTLDRTGYSWGPLALSYLTTALAMQGEIAASAMALSRAQSRHGTKSALFAPELGIARAWRLFTIGDSPAAIAAARGAARMAARGGQYAIAVRAWHESARLGDRQAADGMASIVEHVPCAYTDMARAHARALTAGDAAGLTEAAARLSAAGFAGAAADAARQADVAADAARQADDAARAAQQAGAAGANRSHGNQTN